MNTQTDGVPAMSADLSAEGLTLKQKQAANVWDHVDDALAVIELARAGKWSPYENMQCKYIELRIDMRDGGCLIRDKDGNRIDVTDLRKQMSGFMHGEPWPTDRPPLGDWQQRAAKAAADNNQAIGAVASA
jgi:hypothetical protein